MAEAEATPRAEEEDKDAAWRTVDKAEDAQEGEEGEDEAARRTSRSPAGGSGMPPPYNGGGQCGPPHARGARPSNLNPTQPTCERATNTWRAQSPLVRGRSMVRMRVCVGDRRGVSLNRRRDRGSVLPWSCDLVRGDGDF